MSEQGTDEFLDARPSEEDEVAGVPEADEGGEDMVFLDELGGPPAAGAAEQAPAPPRPRPPRPAGGPAAPGSAARAAPPGSPPGRPSSESGRTSRPGAPARPPSGGPRPAPPGARPGPGDVEPGSRTSSGRLRTLQRSGVGAGTGSGAKLGRPALRPERTADEEAAALAALEARVQPTPTGDPFVGRDLGPFKVERLVELDRGERRYLALHAETQRVVLLRVLPLVGSYADEFKRVADRAERALRVESQTLDSALAVGRTKEAFFAGFDPPVGRTLAELLAAGPLPEAEVVAVIDQVSKALGALHARELAHTHVSIDTIRQLRPGAYVLEGAGLARPRPALSFLAAGGDVLGRPGFIAPETVDGGEHNKASDLYSLGCVAWTLLVGRPPFAGDDEVQVLLDQLNHEVPRLADALPPRAQVSEATVTIVGKLAGYTPDVRYRDLHDLAGDLKAREKGEPVAPFTAAVRAGDDARQRTQVKGVAVSLIILGVLNAALLGLVTLTVLKALAVKLDDPTEGYELPVPPGPR